MSTLKTTNIAHPSSTSNNIVLDSSGNVVLQAGTASAPALQPTSDTNTGIFFPAADTIAFAEGGSEAMRIDSSSRLLVGTSSTSGNSRVIFQGSSNSATGDSVVRLARGSSNPSSGDALGYLVFTDSSHSTAAFIGALRDGGTWTSETSQPTRLVFSTTADGASSPTERMRISSAGASFFNVTSAPGPSNFGTSLEFGRILSFRNVNGTLDVASIGGTAGEAKIMGDGDLENTNNRYTGISDIKLKQNVEDSSSQWDDIKSIQVRKYELIASPERKHIGVVAQEIEQVCPGLVIEREDGNGETYKSVAYSVLYMKAVKALQEAMERIETLETKVAALEAQ
jgi:chaperonin cofactor prefoldin